MSHQPIKSIFNYIVNDLNYNNIQVTPNTLPFVTPTISYGFSKGIPPNPSLLEIENNLKGISYPLTKCTIHKYPFLHPN